MMIRKSERRELDRLVSMGGEAIYVRGQARCLGNLFKRGWVDYPAAYTVRITDEGRAALARDDAERERHATPAPPKPIGTP